jgi:hypothetical protein
VDDGFLYGRAVSAGELDVLRLSSAAAPPPAAGAAGYALLLAGAARVTAPAVTAADLAASFAFGCFARPAAGGAGGAKWETLLYVPGDGDASLHVALHRAADGAAVDRVRVLLASPAVPGSSAASGTFDFTAALPGVAAGEWSKLGVRREGGRVEVLVNGAVVASEAYGSEHRVPLPAGPSPLSIGGSGGEAGPQFSEFRGAVDEILFEAAGVPLLDLRLDEGYGFSLLNAAKPPANTPARSQLASLSLPAAKALLEDPSATPWIASTAPVGSSVATAEDAPSPVCLRGSSSSSSPLTATLTALPSFGTLHLPLAGALPSPSNPFTPAPPHDPAPLPAVPLDLPLGCSLVYVPPPNLAGSPLDTLEYTVSSATETSPAAATISFTVSPSNDPTAFAFDTSSNKLSLSLTDSYISVTDVDSTEEDWSYEALKTSVSVASDPNLPAPFQSPTLSVAGSSAGIVWGAGEVRGGAGVHTPSTSFSSTLSSLNSAVSTLQLTTDTRVLPSSSTVTLSTTDAGLKSDTSSSLTDQHTLTFDYRLAAIPAIAAVSPSLSSLSGGVPAYFLVSNYAKKSTSTMSCVFGSSAPVPATYVSSDPAGAVLSCVVPAASSAEFTSVYLRDEMGFESNRAPFE